MSDVSAWMVMSDGLDLVYRLPALWARVEAGEVRVCLARLVAKKTRDLTEARAAYVDGRVAGYADGRLTWSRFRALVEAAVAAADPAATAEAENEGRRAEAGPAHPPARRPITGWWGSTARPRTGRCWSSTPSCSALPRLLRDKVA